MSMKLTRWVVFELVPGGDILRIHEDLIDWNRSIWMTSTLRMKSVMYF